MLLRTTLLIIGAPFAQEKNMYGDEALDHSLSQHRPRIRHLLLYPTTPKCIAPSGSLVKATQYPEASLITGLQYCPWVMLILAQK